MTNLLCMAALSVFLLLSGSTRDTIVFILIIWTLILCIGLSLSFISAKRRYDRLLRMAEGLEERYLIPEVMEKPKRAEDQVYWQILKMAERSMLEQVENGRRERNKYREYIEQWIHEIKTPITAIRLLCDNNRWISHVKLWVRWRRSHNIQSRAFTMPGAKTRRMIISSGRSVF